MNSKYLTYDAISLAADDSFIQWVQAGRPSQDPWASWVSKNPQVLETVNESADLISVVRFKEKEVSTKADAIWDRINQTIAEDTPDTTVVAMPRRNVFKMVAYAAAACAMLLLASQILLNGDISIQADYGQSLAHTLPDNSTVTLNAGSSIAYAEKDWAKNRTLTLTGEAYFDVEKGQKFAVHTDQGTITVLGTSFNIYSRADGFNVHCTSGKVEVVSSSDTIILTPNTKTTLTANGLVKTDLAQNAEIDWLNKVFKFDSIPLKVVFESIERQFDVEINPEGTNQERLYTGSYNAIDLEKALNTVCFPMELSYTINSNKIIVEPDEGN